MLAKLFSSPLLQNSSVGLRRITGQDLLNPIRLTHPRSFIPKGKIGKRLKRKLDEAPPPRKQDIFDIYKPVTTIEENYKDGFTAQELEESSELVKKALRLNNASNDEIFKFRLEQAVKKFQKFPNDTGSSAVQIAVMTERVLHMANHVGKNRSDHTAKRALQQLLDRRRRLMNYLRRTDFHYYKWVIHEYGLPDAMPKDAHHSSNFHLFQNKNLSTKI